MPAERITLDALDTIGVNIDAQPLSMIDELVAAVDDGRLADPADAEDVLLLAAEIAERHGELGRAVELTTRVVGLLGPSSGRHGFPRALHGEYLLRVGRIDEGLAVLRGLRPRLTRDPDTAAYLAEALEAGGQAELAVDWLTSALEVLLDRLDEDQPDEDADEALGELVARVAVVRRRLRRDLGLALDEHDQLADRLLGIGGDGDANRVVLFFPRAEYNQLMLRWPAAGRRVRTDLGRASPTGRSLPRGAVRIGRTSALLRRRDGRRAGPAPEQRR